MGCQLFFRGVPPEGGGGTKKKFARIFFHTPPPEPRVTMHEGNHFVAVLRPIRALVSAWVQAYVRGVCVCWCRRRWYQKAMSGMACQCEPVDGWALSGTLNFALNTLDRGLGVMQGRAGVAMEGGLGHRFPLCLLEPQLLKGPHPCALRPAWALRSVAGGSSRGGKKCS